MATNSFSNHDLMSWGFCFVTDISRAEAFFHTKILLNPYMINALFHPYQMDESIFKFRVSGVFFFYF